MDFELLMMMLLQTLAIDSVATAPAVVEATTQSIGLLDLLIKGGYMMIRYTFYLYWRFSSLSRSFW